MSRTFVSYRFLAYIDESGDDDLTQKRSAATWKELAKSDGQRSRLRPRRPKFRSRMSITSPSQAILRNGTSSRWIAIAILASATRSGVSSGISNSISWFPRCGSMKDETTNDQNRNRHTKKPKESIFHVCFSVAGGCFFGRWSPAPRLLRIASVGASSLGLASIGSSCRRHLRRLASSLGTRTWINLNRPLKILLVSCEMCVTRPSRGILGDADRLRSS